MVDGVMFCVVVSHVFGTRGPKDVELSLFDTVLYPIKSHVNRFGADLFASFIGNGNGSCVVDLDWSCGLWVAEFFEGGTDGYGLFAVVEGGSNFSFCGRGHDIFEDFGYGEDGAIEAFVRDWEEA